MSASLRKYDVSGRLQSAANSFINDRLLQANIKKDEAIMDEVIPLIEEVRNTWNEAYKLSIGQR